MSLEVTLSIAYIAIFATLVALVTITGRRKIARIVLEEKEKLKRRDVEDRQQQEKITPPTPSTTSASELVPSLPATSSTPVVVEVQVQEPEKRLLASLTQDEIRVLSFLIERGGEAYQMEIYKTLGIPKSTVTKIVRRLSERGLVLIERRGRYNYIKLVNVEQVRRLVTEATPRSE